MLRVLPWLRRQLLSGFSCDTPPGDCWVDPVFLCRYNLTEGVGSWCYMAPEVLLGQAYNESAGEACSGLLVGASASHIL